MSKTRIAGVSGLTALEAVMTAGGPSPLANLAGAWIVRPTPDGSKEIIEVNLRRVRKGKDDDPPLRPGDTINVPDSQQVRFTDPASGYTYVARKYGAEDIDGKQVDRGIAARMLQRNFIMTDDSIVEVRDI